jgi:Fic family protein
MNTSTVTSTVGVLSINLAQRIREEFEEAPGLRLNIGEAAKFWGLDEPTCAQVLGHLLATGFLTRGDDGRYWQT